MVILSSPVDQAVNGGLQIIVSHSLLDNQGTEHKILD